LESNFSNRIFGSGTKGRKLNISLYILADKSGRGAGNRAAGGGGSHGEAFDEVFLSLTTIPMPIFTYGALPGVLQGYWSGGSCFCRSFRRRRQRPRHAGDRQPWRRRRRDSGHGRGPDWQYSRRQIVFDDDGLLDPPPELPPPTFSLAVSTAPTAPAASTSSSAVTTMTAIICRPECTCSIRGKRRVGSPSWVTAEIYQAFQFFRQLAAALTVLPTVVATAAATARTAVPTAHTGVRRPTAAISRRKRNVPHGPAVGG
jgi:hypothetical protein